MTAALRRLVQERAAQRCEYCRIPQSASLLIFHVDHIVAEQHGGQSVDENLALACPQCNLHKGTNLTGMDPDSGRVENLFHPRIDRWDGHFEIRGGNVIGRTAKGRTTVWLLGMNDDNQVLQRGAST